LQDTVLNLPESNLAEFHKEGKKDSRVCYNGAVDHRSQSTLHCAVMMTCVTVGFVMKIPPWLMRTTSRECSTGMSLNQYCYSSTEEVTAISAFLCQCHIMASKLLIV